MLLTMTITPEDLQEGDLILKIDGVRIPGNDNHVIETQEFHALLETTNTIERRFYYASAEELFVRRDLTQLVLPSEAHGIISDSLLMMIERLRSEGHPHAHTRHILDLWHTFVHAYQETEVTIRPKHKEDLP